MGKKTKLKKGDLIKCESEKDMIRIVNALEMKGIITDYYKENDEYWVKVLEVGRRVH